MTSATGSSALERILSEDAIGQLCDRRGAMAALGSENGIVALDWVQGVRRALDLPGAIERVEREARTILSGGIRHVIWAGMGGSVMAVRVLADLFSPLDGLTILLLDSTDPEMLNDIVRRIARLEGIDEDALANEPEKVRPLLAHTMMIGVAMGMTSAEPITHLEWFLELLERAGLPVERHTLAMALPGSLLEQFSARLALPIVRLQLDGRTGTGGRMSAPSTRVFLLPAALIQATLPTGESLRDILEEAWRIHALESGRRNPVSHPFVRLAAVMSDRSCDGALLLSVDLPGEWGATFPWIEQLLEESLGKRGRGIVAFGPGHFRTTENMAHVTVALRPLDNSSPNCIVVPLPYLTVRPTLAEVGAFFMGWQLATALFGWLHDIQFAGQPAVENYKARARALRDSPDDWRRLEGDGGPDATILTVDEFTAPATAALLSSDIARLAEQGALDYIDVTYNGELPVEEWHALDCAVRRVAGDLLRVPYKLRRAPASYHSTEQSEMDGPPKLFSLRLISSEHENPLIGSYDARFLRAQAIGTWQAMRLAGRPCRLVVLGSDGPSRTEFVRSIGDRLP